MFSVEKSFPVFFQYLLKSNRCVFLSDVIVIPDMDLESVGHMTWMLLGQKKLHCL